MDENKKNIDLLKERLKQLLVLRGITEDVEWFVTEENGSKKEGPCQFSCGCCKFRMYFLLLKGVSSGQIYFFDPQDEFKDFNEKLYGC